MTRTRRWLAAAAAALSLALAAGPALADTITISDADDDAFSLVDGTVSVGDYDIDLRAVRIDHGASVLTIASTFSFVNSDSFTSLMVKLDTNRDGVADFGVLWTPDDGTQGVLTLDATGAPTGVTCTNVDPTETFGVNGTATLAIPRSCINDPATVAVHVDAFWDGVNTAGDELTFLDSAPDTVSADVTSFSPAVAVARATTVPSAQSPHPAANTTITAKLSATSQKVGGKPAKLTIRVNGGGSPSGTVTIIDGRRKLRTLAVRAHRATTYTLPRKLKAGLHKITIKFTPTNAAYAASTKVVKVRVHH